MAILKRIPDHTQMTRHLYESNLIARVPKERLKTFNRQSMVVWKEMIARKRLTARVVLQAHKALLIYQAMPDRYLGHYRDFQVRVGKHLGTDPGILRWAMDNWFLDMIDWRKHTPREMHIRFEKIHPFLDGNGRIGRLCMWWHQRKLGQPRLLILHENRKEYYDWWK